MSMTTEQRRTETAWECDMRLQRDARRNETITRGELLGALESVREHASLTGVGRDTYVLIDTLRRVLE
jgi:hypothetical protein